MPLGGYRKYKNRRGCRVERIVRPRAALPPPPRGGGPGGGGGGGGGDWTKMLTLLRGGFKKQKIRDVLQEREGAIF